MYVVSLDLYVQVDGVRWHGLDRSINEIARSERNDDQIIFKKWKRDRLQERFCVERGLRLARVTDLQVIEAVKTNTIDQMIDRVLCGGTFYKIETLIEEKG